MTRLAHSPRKESYPIAHPYYTAWLYSASLDGYNTGELADSPIYTASRSPTGEVNRTTGAALPTGSIIADATNGVPYFMSSAGVITALGTSGAAQSWTGLQTFTDGIALLDNDAVTYGTGSDVSTKWDAAKLVTIPIADDTLWELGNGTLSMDLTIYGNTAGAHTKWDASANTLTLTGIAFTCDGIGTFTGLVNGSTLDQNAIIDQDTADTAGTGAAYDSLGTSTSATGSYAIIKGTFQQITNAKTAGVGFGVQGTYVGLAGDTSGALVGGLYAAAPTLNGGSALASGLAIAAGWTHDIYFADTTAKITMQDAAGVSLVIQDSAGNAFLSFDTAAVDGISVGNATTNPVFTVLGTGGTDVSAGTLTVGAQNISGIVTFADGSVLRRAGSGSTGDGDTIEQVGSTSAQGMEVRVWDNIVSPAAIETALLTLPANSVIDSVQANVQAALTGGGTTVTFGVGITGDVDAYGTAFSGGVPSDLLTQNAKINAIGTRAAAGAGIGVYNAATVAVKLIGAATGGATAGDTALSVGSVRVVVRYRVLVSLANA